MKASLLLSFVSMTLIWAAPPAVGIIAPKSMKNNDPAATMINLSGANLGSTSLCKLVATSGVEINLDLTRVAHNLLHVALPMPTKGRPAVPPGVYHFRVGTPSENIVTTGNLTIAIIGPAVRMIDPVAALHTGQHSVVLGGDLLPDVKKVVLRDRSGEDWPVAISSADQRRLIISFATIPAGEYDIVLLGNGDGELGKSPTKFRAFANPK